jgi:hypothetical protein
MTSGWPGGGWKVTLITHVPPLLADPLVLSGRPSVCLRGGRDRLSGTGPIGWPRDHTGEGGLIGDPTSLLVQHGAHHGPGNRDQDHDRRGVGGHRQDRHCSGGREHEQADPGPQTPWIGLLLGHGIPPCWPPTSFSFVSARQRHRAELPVRHARGVLAPCGNAPRSGSPPATAVPAPRRVQTVFTRWDPSWHWLRAGTAPVCDASMTSRWPTDGQQVRCLTPKCPGRPSLRSHSHAMITLRGRCQPAQNTHDGLPAPCADARSPTGAQGTVRWIRPGQRPIPSPDTEF